MTYKIEFSNAHPNAQRLMPDEFFYSVIDGFAPFGDDDSWETFMAFKDWLSEHTKGNKIEFIENQLDYFGYSRFDLRTQDFNVLKEYIQSNSLGMRYLLGTDQVIIATAFGQLYLQGLIDLNLRALAKVAIQRQLLPEMVEMYKEHKVDREKSLNKLLKVISPNN